MPYELLSPICSLFNSVPARRGKIEVSGEDQRPALSKQHDSVSPSLDEGIHITDNLLSQNSTALHSTVDLDGDTDDTDTKAAAPKVTRKISSFRLNKVYADGEFV